MRAAQINGHGVVVNFAEVPGFDDQFIDPQDAVIGSTWDGSVFTAPSTPVPQSVTYRQGMAVLIKHNLDTTIQAALDAQLSAAQQANSAPAILAAKLALNDWKNSIAFERKWPLIAQMQVAFSWSDAFVDALFIEAATL